MLLFPAELIHAFINTSACNLLTYHKRLIDMENEFTKMDLLTRMIGYHHDESSNVHLLHNIISEAKDSDGVSALQRLVNSNKLENYVPPGIVKKELAIRGFAMTGERGNVVLTKQVQKIALKC